MISQFEKDYERLFGKGSGYAAAGIALTALRLKGSAELSGLRFDEINSGDVGTGPAEKGSRAVIWYERGLEPEMTAVSPIARSPSDRVDMVISFMIPRHTC